jgi:uncharacterized protein
MEKDNFFNDTADEIARHELFLQGKNVFSHGSISIYTHSLNVARLAYKIALELSRKLSVDKKCVIRAALLHDFFLYEWHIPGLRYIKHGWAHPSIAAEKAREVFAISDKEYSCIKTHMWPWTFWRLPRCREAWIISFADKAVALKETLLHRGKRVLSRD